MFPLRAHGHLTVDRKLREIYRKRQDSLQQGALMFANAEEEFFYEVRMPRFISVSSSSCS